MSDLQTFREEVRLWLEANCPPSQRIPPAEDEVIWAGSHIEFSNEDQRLWFERMRDRGWFVPDWPTAYGGGGLDRAQTRILEEEMARLKCRPPQLNLGVWMLGPVLFEFGSEEQKRRFLPPMARGEIRWCQGYSEPNAGSDLASLKTSAHDAGDHFIVNGSKIWTSGADKSDWMYALVRTDPGATKHEGISFILLDMRSPGVSVRPIELISGASHFCQVFFNEVRVPKDQLVGPLNGGWTVGKRLLQHERNVMSKLGDLNLPSQSDLVSLLRVYLPADSRTPGDAAIRARGVACAMEEQAFKLTVQRMAEEARAGIDVGGLTAIVKLVHTEQDRRKHDVLLDAMGNRALGWEGEGFSTEELAFTRNWLLSYTNSIAGGTSEIQLNIIAKRVLGLPAN